MGFLRPKLSDSQKSQMANDAPFLLPPSGEGFVTFFRALAFAVFCFLLLELLIWVLVLKFPPPRTPYIQSVLEWAIQLFSFYSAWAIFRAGLSWPRAVALGDEAAVLMGVARRMFFGAFGALFLGLVLAYFGFAPPWRPDLEAIRPLVHGKLLKK